MKSDPGARATATPGDGRALWKALGFGAVFALLAVAASLLLPVLLGVPPEKKDSYDGVIGAIAGALIGGAVAASITIYVLDRSTANQNRLHAETIELFKEQHLQILRQQARGVRVEATYDEAARLATATRRLFALAAAESTIPAADQDEFLSSSAAFEDKAHHVEMEHFIVDVRSALRAGAAVDVLRETARTLYLATCTYMRAQSVSGVDSDVTFEPSPADLR